MARSQFSQYRPREWPSIISIISILLLFVIGCCVLEYRSSIIPVSSPRRAPAKYRDLDTDSAENVVNSIAVEKYSVYYNLTKFGDALLPTPWQRSHSLLEPGEYDFQRARQILNCSSYIWPANANDRRELAQKNLTHFPVVDQNECPSYFSWIDRDLEPWKQRGIQRLNVDMAKEYTAYKVIIWNGKLFLDLYEGCFQTRILFTLWGILLLLDKYKDRVPNVEVMFNCADKPQIEREAFSTHPQEHRDFGSEDPGPPILFSYCSNREHYDIPWPDWSFWGWPELQVETWDVELHKILKGSKNSSWESKAPKAYWSGNPVTAKVRGDLVKCSKSKKSYKIDTAQQNWGKEIMLRKRNSKLQDQCTHRYMVYAEGKGWSVSLKYILACGSPTFVIAPKYFDFFSRGLEAGVHYIPILPSKGCEPELCKTIDLVVDFGESDPEQVKGIGKAGQDFVLDELAMTNVYNYMLYSLQAYAHLQRFQPLIPDSAYLITQEYLLCLAQPRPLQRLLLLQARKKHTLINEEVCQMSFRNQEESYPWDLNKDSYENC